MKKKATSKIRRLFENTTKNGRKKNRLKKLTEQEMQKEIVPTPQSLAELNRYISAMVDRDHDYGTEVYAMSMVAAAAFQYVASKLGVSGFQASGAGLDFLRRVRGMECGFRIIDYKNLLFPQYLTPEHFPTMQDLLRDNCKELGMIAQQKIKENPKAHPSVMRHWENLVEQMEDMKASKPTNSNNGGMNAGKE